MKWTHGAALMTACVAWGAAWTLSACSGDDNGTIPPDGGTDSADSGRPDTNTDAGVVSCEAYCNNVQSNCRGDVRPQGRPEDPTEQYSTTEGCLHACSKMALGLPEDEVGDTVGCRTYHSGVPAAGEPAVHCPHSGIAGGGLCSGRTDSGAGGRCASFCKMALALCAPAALADAGATSLEIPFAGEAECLDACGNDNPRSFNFDRTLNERVPGGDTLNCRQYHLAAAYEEPPGPDGRLTENTKAHCKHLRPKGGTPPVAHDCTSDVVDGGP